MKDKTNEIIRLFQRNNGYIRTKQLKEANIHPYHLQKLLKQGKVEKIKRGFYHLKEYSDNEIILVQKLVPAGIFCTFTAWNYYELTTYQPFEYHIAIEKKQKVTLPEYPPVKLYYWDKNIFHLGQTTVEIEQGQIRIYDMERSVCDAVRLRNKIGKDIMLEILKNYLQRRDRNLSKLLDYAGKLRIKSLIKPYIEALQ